MRHPSWSSQPARDRAHAGIAHARGVLGRFAHVRACWANTFYNEVIMRCHMGSLVQAYWTNTSDVLGKYGVPAGASDSGSDKVQQKGMIG